MAEKEATVYIVDVSRSMGQSHAERQVSDLDWSLQYVWDKITNTVSTNRKTAMLGVVGLGTDKTKNQMQAEDDSYMHISMIQPIQQTLMADLRRLPQELKVSNIANIDAVSAIVIAIDMITKHCKKLKFTKRIIMTTNGGGQIDEDDLDPIAQQITDNEIQLVVLGIDFDDLEYGVKEENKSPAKARNERILEKLVKKCSTTGSIFGTMQEAIDNLARPETKVVRPTPTYRGQLRLGDPNNYDTAITIDVERYFKTSIRRAPTASAYAKTTNQSQEDNKLSAVHSQLTYVVKDEKERDGVKHLTREELAKGYEYGRTAVHISEIDENITKLETEAAYEIIGFIPSEHVERYTLIDNSNVLVAPKVNDKAALALGSLIQALVINNSVAVARFVKKDMQEPLVTLLSPSVTADHQCLIENILPFAEDIRAYRFPPLDKVLTMSGKTITQHRNLPSDDLLQTMSDFVDGMSLLDNEEEEVMEMDDMFSPVLHTIEGAIRYRAVYPDNDLPPKSDAFLAYSKQPAELQSQSKEALKRLIKAADVKKVPPKVKGRKRYRDVEKPLSGLDVDALFTAKKKTKISPDNAVPEFRQMLDSADSDETMMDAVNQMTTLVEKQISSGFGENNSARAIEYLGVMRKELLELEMPTLYKDAIGKLKEKVLSGKYGPQTNFWYDVKRAGLAPINKNELDVDNGMSAEEAAAFMSKKSD